MNSRRGAAAQARVEGVGCWCSRRKRRQRSLDGRGKSVTPRRAGCGSKSAGASLGGRWNVGLESAGRGGFLSDDSGVFRWCSDAVNRFTFRLTKRRGGGLGGGDFSSRLSPRPP